MAKTMFFHFIFALSILGLSSPAFSSTKVTKIVAIHSYSDDFPWTQMLRDSYIEELRTKGLKFEINNIYFDVKKNPIPIGNQHPLLTSIEKNLASSMPDLIFISDDFALQQLAPFLIEHKIPFVFSGLNGEIPEIITESKFKKYTGVYERYYVFDSVKLLKRILSKNKLRLLVLLEQSETSAAVAAFTKKELSRFKDVKFEILISGNFEEWKTAVLTSKEKYDALLPLQPYALNDPQGKNLEGPAVIKWIYENSLIPTVYTGQWHIKCGGTLAIVIRPHAQGKLAADYSIDLLKNLIHKPIPPPQGDIVINYAVTEKLKIQIPFDLLTTSTIEKSIETPCNPK